MNYKNTILLVEDDQTIIDLLLVVLTSHDYKVIQAKTGKDALQLCISHNPELILLDLGLPDIDGMNVLREIHAKSDVPVIVLSARHDEMIKVEALEGGADDYIVKPFGNFELLARIHNTIKLHERIAAALFKEEDIYRHGAFCIDFAAHKVSLGKKAIHLTPIEYKIVSLLSKNAGKVLTHEQIINQVWGPNNCDSQVLRVNMANIRRKIEINLSDPQIILTELGVGYRMAEIV